MNARPHRRLRGRLREGSHTSEGSRCCEMFTRGAPKAVGGRDEGSQTNFVRGLEIEGAPWGLGKAAGRVWASKPGWD